MYINIWGKQQHLRILKELKLIVIDTHYSNVLEIMNRNEQELYKDIKRLATAMEKLVKLMTKLMKEQS